MARRNDTKEQLIDAAIWLMRARGYGAVGVDAICKRARVNKGSFYHFFPSKSELAITALECLWNEYQAQVLEPAFSRDVPPLDRLIRFFEANFDRQRLNHERTGHVSGCLFGSLGCELSGQDEMIRLKIETILAGFQRYFEEVLVEAAEDGMIEPGNMALVGEALVVFMEGLLLKAKIGNKTEILQQLVPCVLRLIGAREAPTQRLVPVMASIGASGMNGSNNWGFID